MLLPADDAQFSQDVRCAESLLFTVQRASPACGQRVASHSPPIFSFFFYLSLPDVVFLRSVCEVTRSKNVKDNSGGGGALAIQQERVKNSHV